MGCGSVVEEVEMVEVAVVGAGERRGRGLEVRADGPGWLVQTDE